MEMIKNDLSVLLMLTEQSDDNIESTVISLMQLYKSHKYAPEAFASLPKYGFRVRADVNIRRDGNASQRDCSIELILRNFSLSLSLVNYMRMVCL